MGERFSETAGKEGVDQPMNGAVHDCGKADDQVDLEKGVKLRLKFDPDTRLFYTLQTQLEQQVQRAGKILNESEDIFESYLRQRVLARDEDGCGHILTVTTPPVDEPGPEKMVVYQRINELGYVQEVSGLNPLNSIALPIPPVKEGSTWNGEVLLPVPQSPQPIRCRTRYEITGTHDYAGYECVVIDCEADEFEFDLPLPDGSGVAKVLMGSQGSLLFAPKEGILVQMEMENVTSPHIGEVSFTTSVMLTLDLRAVES